jgi:hypothetical protein
LVLMTWPTIIGLLLVVDIVNAGALLLGFV